MKILKFTKKKDGMYSLLLENDDILVVHEDLILKHGLLLHKEVDEDMIEKLEEENLNYTAKTVALKYITVRFRSEKEVRNNLNKKGVSKDIINFTIDSLKKEGYIDDDNFTKMFIHDKINLSMDGPYKVRKELDSYGISESIINDNIDTYTREIEEDKINKIIDKQIKINHNKSNYILRNKILNYLKNNGYDSSLAISIIDKKEFGNDKDIAKVEYEKLYKKLSKKYSGSELEYKIKQKMYQKGFGSFE